MTRNRLNRQLFPYYHVQRKIDIPHSSTPLDSGDKQEGDGMKLLFLCQFSCFLEPYSMFGIVKRLSLSRVPSFARACSPFAVRCCVEACYPV